MCIYILPSIELNKLLQKCLDGNGDSRFKQLQKRGPCRKLSEACWIACLWNTLLNVSSQQVQFILCTQMHRLKFLCIYKKCQNRTFFILTQIGITRTNCGRLLYVREQLTLTAKYVKLSDDIERAAVGKMQSLIHNTFTYFGWWPFSLLAIVQYRRTSQQVGIQNSLIGRK